MIFLETSNFWREKKMIKKKKGKWGRERELKKKKPRVVDNSRFPEGEI